MNLRAAQGIAPSERWLRALRESWPRAVCRLLEQGESAVVRVLVAEVRGSAPREPGTCMLVVGSGIFGTIGGGNLEWQAMRAARSFLAAGSAMRSVQLRRLVLARELGQCCGGVVQLWLDRFTKDDLPLLQRAAREHATESILWTRLSKGEVVRTLTRRDAGQLRLQFTAVDNEQASLLEPIHSERAVLWLFGAGHVAQALIHVLSELPFDVTWVDSRAELLPAPLPDNVHSLCTQAPINSISSAPAGARFLVMTHDHSLDYVLCRRILERQDFAWLGLIGSKSKGARFRSRLARDGITPAVIARLTCPIGIDGLRSKLPAAIAVAVAAQLLLGLRPAADHEATISLNESCGSPDCAACAGVRPTTGKPGSA